MEENSNVGIGTASGILAGSAVGGYAGAKIAPNVVGKINIENALERTPYADVVRDKFYSAGKNTGEYFDAAKGIIEIYKKNGAGEAQNVFLRIAHNNVFKVPPELSVKEIRELLKKPQEGESKIVMEARGKMLKALEECADDQKLTCEKLGEIFSFKEEAFAKAKSEIENLMNSLPKQKGKYAAICAIAGGLAVGLCAYITSSLISKSQKK